MKRDDDSHSMSNSQFEVVSVAEYLKLLTVIFMIWFIFACLSVWVLKSRPIRASLISTASGSWVLEINKSLLEYALIQCFILKSLRNYQI